VDGRHPAEPVRFHLVIEGGRCEVRPGAHPSPRLSLGYGFADFQRSMAGQLDEDQAFSTGRLRIVGDIGLAGAMGRWFDDAPEEPATAKEAD
jgi:putative sterol carrier protein